MTLIGRFNLSAVWAIPSGPSWSFEGDQADVRAGTAFPVSSHVITTASQAEFEDITFTWANSVADQNPTFAFISGLKSESALRRCVFQDSSFRYNIGATVSAAQTDVLFQDTRFTNYLVSAVAGTTTSSRVIVDRCETVTAFGTAPLACDLQGTDCKVLNSTHTGCLDGIKIGSRGMVSGNRLVGIGSFGVGVHSYGDGLADYIHVVDNSISTFQNPVRPDVKSGSTNVICHYVTAFNRIDVYKEGYYAVFGATDLDASATHTVVGNMFLSSIASGSGIRLQYGRAFCIADNSFVENDSNGIRIQTTSWGLITNNYMDGYDADVTGSTYSGIAVETSSTNNPVYITNNQIDTRNLTSGNGEAHIRTDRSNVLIQGNYLTTTSAAADHAIIATRTLGMKIVNNHIGDTDEDSIFVSNASALVEEEGILIQGNHLDGVATGFSLIYIEGFSGYNISNNVFGTGAGSVIGAGVTVRSGPGAGSEANFGRVSNNFFHKVRGAAAVASTNSVIDIRDGAGPVPTNVVIEGNILVSCGTTSTVANVHLIYCAIAGSQIRGNMIVTPLANTGVLTLIRIDATDVVADNNYSELVITAYTTVTTLRGIYMSNRNVSRGNYFNWTGSASGPSVAIHPVYPEGSSDCMVSHNYITAYDQGTLTAAAQAAINGATCANMVALGNFSKSRKINFSGGSGGMVLGNVGKGDATDPGTHATSGNI
jgi:parallel beta-helix repeat protein